VSVQTLFGADCTRADNTQGDDSGSGSVSSAFDASELGPHPEPRSAATHTAPILLILVDKGHTCTASVGVSWWLTAPLLLYAYV
jgi:hypothetical protein